MIEIIPIDTAFDAIVAEIETPAVARRSIKYRIIPERTRIVMDFVFADNPTEAEAKARSIFSLESDEEVIVARVNESTGTTGKLIKGI